jgi:hypothetical protein
MICTEMLWLRIRTSGGLFWIRLWVPACKMIILDNDLFRKILFLKIIL